MTLITKNAGTEVSDEKLTYASNIIKKLGCKDPKPGAAVAPPDHSYNSTNSPLQFAKQPENKEMDGYAPSARPAAPRAPAAEHEEPDGGPHYKDQEDLSRPAAAEPIYDAHGDMAMAVSRPPPPTAGVIINDDGETVYEVPDGGVASWNPELYAVTDAAPGATARPQPQPAAPNSSGRSPWSRAAR